MKLTLKFDHNVDAALLKRKRVLINRCSMARREETSNI